MIIDVRYTTETIDSSKTLHLEHVKLTEDDILQLAIDKALKDNSGLQSGNKFIINAFIDNVNI